MPACTHKALSRPSTVGVAEYGLKPEHVPTRITKLLTTVTGAHHATKVLNAIENAHCRLQYTAARSSTTVMTNVRILQPLTVTH